jgi:hypothetical protein
MRRGYAALLRTLTRGAAGGGGGAMLRALPALRQRDACAAAAPPPAAAPPHRTPPLLRRCAAAAPPPHRAPHAPCASAGGARRGACRAAPAPSPALPPAPPLAPPPLRFLPLRRAARALATFAKKGGASDGASATSSPPSDSLGKGSLVTFDKGDGRELLVLITRPDGKQRWFGTDAVRDVACALVRDVACAWGDACACARARVRVRCFLFIFAPPRRAAP